MASAILDCDRSDAFWFEDGNVILHAQVANIAFRVHRTVLSAHSSFFEDMFKTLQPEDEALFEGCQVVPLYHDSLEDWENVLTCIYQPIKLNPSLEGIKIEQIISMLRLGRKYQFDDIFNACIDRLRQELPQSLEAFDGVSTVIGRTPLYERPVALLVDLFTLINFAIEMEIEVILPAAYYTVVSLASVKDIFHGRMTPDGTRTVTLCAAAQEAIFRGKEELHTPIFRWYFDRHHGFVAVPYEPDEACRDKAESKTSCEEGFKWSRECIQNLLSGQPLRFALSPCIETQLYSDIFLGMCCTCYLKERGFREMHRRKLWQELPMFFGLEKRWDQLSFYRV